MIFHYYFLTYETRRNRTRNVLKKYSSYTDIETLNKTETERIEVYIQPGVEVFNVFCDPIPVFLSRREAEGT